MAMLQKKFRGASARTRHAHYRFTRITFRKLSQVYLLGRV